MYNLNNIKLDFLTHTAERIENISDEDYFGEAFKDYVSNSLLTLLNPEQGGAPTKFLSGFVGSKSGAFELGSAVHQMILEKEKYFLSPVDKPSGKIGLICDSYHVFKKVEGLSDEEALKHACEEHDYYKGKLTDKRLEEIKSKGNEYLEFLDVKSETPGAIVLTEVQKEKLYGCLESVKANKLIMELLEPSKTMIDKVTGEVIPVDVRSFNEDVMVMSVKATMPSDDPEDFGDTEFTFNLKSKIDNWSIDFTNKVVTLNDLKSTGTPINQFGGISYEVIGGDGNTYKSFQKGSFQKFHYHRQMAMYAFILKNYVMNAFDVDDTWEFKVNMLVVETNQPYMSQVFSVGERSVKAGIWEFESMLKRYAFHKVKGFDTFVEMDLTKPTEIA